MLTNLENLVLFLLGLRFTRCLLLGADRERERAFVVKKLLFYDKSNMSTLSSVTN